ncbi:MAG: DnaA regulatory inactivator Hda [Pseudomonadota bacterium]
MPLAVGVNAPPAFDNFVPGVNQEVCNQVLAWRLGEVSTGLFLWGGSGTGKSHLLRAAAELDAGCPCHYLSLANMNQAELATLATHEAFCLDDLDGLLGQADGENALFRLFLGLQADNGRWLVAARSPPRALPVQLPDLRSRWMAAPVFQLRPPDDAARLVILQGAARRRGLTLDEESASYLLHRVSRDLHALDRLMNHLDRLTLAVQRRITIPLLREVLEQVPDDALGEKRHESNPGGEDHNPITIN